MKHKKSNPYKKFKKLLSGPKLFYMQIFYSFSILKDLQELKKFNNADRDLQ